mmetsp:Transcript_76841/g.207549  ORF Transcript_76841/g.207549 Transcript_76841/m.207549 type:complete len:214 (+) Transcript_76841:597-1238(+)
MILQDRLSLVGAALRVGLGAHPQACHSRAPASAAGGRLWRAAPACCFVAASVSFGQQAAPWLEAAAGARRLPSCGGRGAAMLAVRSSALERAAPRHGCWCLRARTLRPAGRMLPARAAPHRQSHPLWPLLGWRQLCQDRGGDRACGPEAPLPSPGAPGCSAAVRGTCLRLRASHSLWPCLSRRPLLPMKRHLDSAVFLEGRSAERVCVRSARG